MKWKNFKLRAKFSVAFGVVIILLVIVATWAIYGINSIVKNANETIDGNNLKNNLEDKYIQHLKWAANVISYITNKQITELQVETDYNKCALGQWYYGIGRENAEKLAPELKSLFDKLEEPHKNLHNSAIKIKEVFKNADYDLGIQLREQKCNHLLWVIKIKDAILNSNPDIEFETDPAKCKLGQWLNSDNVENLKKEYPELPALLNDISELHENLHQSVISIQDYLSQNKQTKAYESFKNQTQPLMDNTLEKIDQIIKWNNENYLGYTEATNIYFSETQVSLNEISTLFHDIIEKSRDYIMSEDVMLNQATNKRSGVIFLSLLAAIIAIILATILTRSIIKPINKGIVLARKISTGDLTAEIDIDQKDEIGLLAASLRKMSEKIQTIVEDIISGSEQIAVASQEFSNASQNMSQGANEQASSAEEISSSVEEMAATIQQNTENSQQTEKIALTALENIKKGNESSIMSAESMKNIANKISIISEIAFQTNILALNAAVEAARAGEHGRGFAVVAAEVRKLAERSKVAAEEINKVSQSGVNISEEVGRQFVDLVPEIEKTTKLIQEITAASLEQSSGAEQINNVIQQLNQVTQQNAATAEELATNSEELASQAQQLRSTISFFKVRDKHGKEYSKISKISKSEKMSMNTNYIQTQKKKKDIGVELLLKETTSDDAFEKF